MIVTLKNKQEMYINDSKVLWARADGNLIEIAIADRHGLETSWQFKTSKARDIVTELENGCIIEFVEEE
jgi:hypothetical protein